jgi:hypothetical protein
MKKLKKIIIGFLVVALLSSGAIASNLLQGEQAILVDGDMDRSSTTAWTSANSAVLSKVTVNGNGNNRALKVAYGGTANFFTVQSGFTIGEEYKFQGRARSNGTCTPALYPGGGAAVWTGTTSTDWQYFDVVGEQVNTTDIRLFCLGSSGYSEWDYVHTSLYIPPVKNAEVSMVKNGDFEQSTLNFWSVGAGATLTRDTVNPYQDDASLKVAYNGITDPYATQTTFTAGDTYRATGCAQSDGVAIPRYSDSGLATWTGVNTTTDWQCFDVVFTAAATVTRLYALTSSAGSVKWDNIQVTKYTPPIKNYEQQVLVDGDMERVGTGAYSANSGAVLSKQAYLDGQIFRVTTLNGDAGSQAKQTILVAGETYNITGKVRDDGLADAFILVGAAGSNPLTTTTEWSTFDITDVATDSGLFFATGHPAADQDAYIEWDDVQVTLIP